MKTYILAYHDIHLGEPGIEPITSWFTYCTLTIVITYVRCNHNNYMFSYYEIFRTF